MLTAESAELYATRRADFSRDDHGEGEVEGSGSSEGTLAAMRAAVMDPLQVRLVVNGGCVPGTCLIDCLVATCLCAAAATRWAASGSQSRHCDTDIWCAKQQ